MTVEQMNLVNETPTTPQLSVIVPTYNRPAELRRCLQALAQQTFPQAAFEVLICDDGSTADIAAVVNEVAATSGLPLRHLRQAQAGPAAARNLGIRNARGAIVAMTDSDTLPDANWLAELAAAFAAHPQAVAVEGQVYAQNEGAFGLLGEGPTNRRGGVYLTCNCAYRRAALVQAGGFDETFPYAAYEDVELAARVQPFGEIVWQPRALVVHPERPLTLQAVLKKLHHWEFVLIMGLRYGYLAWRQYPVRHPRLRVAALATLALPLAKFKKAFAALTQQPAAACKLMGFGIVEALGALVLVAPKALFGDFRARVVRKDYLR